MIRLKGDARTPSCFAVAGPPAVPECRKAASLAVAAGAREVRAAISGPAGVCPRVGQPMWIHEG